MEALDNKISFVAGFLFTAATSVSMMGLVQAAGVGLIGGFFGLLGKEIFYYTKRKLRSVTFRARIKSKLANIRWELKRLFYDYWKD